MINGLLLLDKPAELTSHDVVARLRKALGQKGVGHTGTLDPIATGLMIMVLGEATKLSDYLTAADKSYRVKVRLGVTTDSLDRAGKILSEKPCDKSAAEVRSAALALSGEFDWPVPVFSAAKVDGKKLYEFGRAGQEIETPKKRMKFYDVKVLECGSNFADVELSCSKGSFIRSWAAQLGEVLGCGGIVQDLRRTRVGRWQVADALTLDQIEADPEAAKSAIIPMGSALPDLKSVMAGPKEARLMMHGQIPRDLAARLIFEQKAAIASGEAVFVKVLTATGDLLAILAGEPGQGLKIRRVFR